MEYCLANVFGSIRVTHSLYLLTTFDVQLKIFKENETTRLKTSYVYAVVCSEIENRFFFSAQPPCIVWKSVFFFWEPVSVWLAVLQARQVFICGSRLNLYIHSHDRM